MHDPCDKSFLLVPCGDLDLDLLPTSRSNLLPGRTIILRICLVYLVFIFVHWEIAYSIYKPSARYISLTMKYNMFKGMVHLVGILQAQIQGGEGVRTSDFKFQQAKNKKRQRERGQLWG